MTDAIQKQARPIDSLKGFLTENLEAKIKVDSAADCDLIIETPSLSFVSIGKKRFVRKLETIINFQDSTEHGLILSYNDTLDAKALSKVRKSKYPELRGENPRVVGKYLGPALLIGTAIAGIILLFYLRS